MNNEIRMIPVEISSSEDSLPNEPPISSLNGKKQQPTPQFNKPNNSNNYSLKEKQVKYLDLGSLRSEMSRIRDRLFDIQNQEDQTLETYAKAETEKQQKINALKKNCKKANFPNIKKNQNYIHTYEELKQLFETSIQQSEENRKLREQIVENDHHNYFKINEEQNRASDARFKYDGDRLALEQARLEYDRMKLENTELKELAESIRDEYIGLNSQEKIYQDEFVRIENKLNSQKKKFNELTEIYIEVKQKNDILNKEREKREEIYKKRLEDAIEKRDNLKNFIDDVKNQQKEADEAVEAAKNKIEDLIFDRDRLDSEIQHLIQMKERRNEQQIQFNLLLNNV